MNKSLVILAIVGLCASSVSAKQPSRRADFSGYWVLSVMQTKHLPAELKAYSMSVSENAQQLEVRTNLEGKLTPPTRHKPADSRRGRTARVPAAKRLDASTTTAGLRIRWGNGGNVLRLSLTGKDALSRLCGMWHWAELQDRWKLSKDCRELLVDRTVSIWYSVSNLHQAESARTKSRRC